MNESREIERLQYRVRCRDCRFGRFYGMAKLTAHVKATSHALRLMHTVDLYEMDLGELGTVTETISPRSVQAGVTESDDPPF